MSNRTTHLEDDELLRLLDGELEDGAASAGRSHVEACWTCRTRMEELESAIGDYVRYREAMEPLYPPPPGLWKDLKPAMEQVDRSLDGLRIGAPRHKQYFRPRAAQWLAVAAAAVIALVLIRRFERVPAVSAAELLRKAAVAEQAAAPRKRIRIQTRHHSFTREATLARSAAGAGELEQLFVRAHFNWQEPLSARSFSAWHDQLSEKQDTVNSSRDDVYIVRTSTTSSELRQATLTLRKPDLRPTKEMLEFVSETVEITDAPDSDGPPGAPMAEPSRLPSETTRVMPPEPARSRSHRELQVFSALHRIGADLGEPVELRERGSTLIVTGTGLTPPQQQRLRTSLQPISGVEVRFEDATPSTSDSGTRPDDAAPATAPLQLRLQALLGSRQSVEDFTNRALDGSDAMMARVHALRALTKAFPPDVESSLDSADQGILLALRNDHAAALVARLRDLKSLLQPVLRAPSRGDASPDQPWQAAVQEIFNRALNLDQLLNRVLAGSDTDAGDRDFEQIGAALARVEAQAAAFEQSANSKP